MDRTYLIGAAITLLVLAGVALAWPSTPSTATGTDSVDGAVAPATISGGDAFSPVHRTTNTLAGITVERSVYDANETRAVITVLRDTSRSFADRYTEETWNDLQSQYVSREAPYAAVPREAVECEQRYVPEFPENGSDIRSYTVRTLYSTGSYDLGACTADTVANTAHMMMVYCPSTGDLYRLTVHVPGNASATPGLLTSFSCPGDSR